LWWGGVLSMNRMSGIIVTIVRKLMTTGIPMDFKKQKQPLFTDSGHLPLTNCWDVGCPVGSLRHLCHPDAFEAICQVWPVFVPVFPPCPHFDHPGKLALQPDSIDLVSSGCGVPGSGAPVLCAIQGPAANGSSRQSCGGLSQPCPRPCRAHQKIAATGDYPCLSTICYKASAA
jgi:hypothetical protein